MTLKKCMAGYFIKTPVEITSGSGEKITTIIEEWVEQQEIDMHPLEEAATRAHWAIHDVSVKVPPKPTPEEENDFILSNGLDVAQKRRAEWQKLHDENQVLVKAAEEYFHAQHKIWCDHANDCVAKGLDPNTYDKEKYSAIS